MSCASWSEGILSADCSYKFILLAADGGAGPEVPRQLRERDGLAVGCGVKEFLLLTAPIQLSSLLQTEVRAQKYQASCMREMVELCSVV